LRRQEVAEVFRDGPFEMRPRDGAKWADQIAIGDSARAGGLAGQTAETAIDMRLGIFPGQSAFEHLFHQDDATSRSIHFLAELGIGRAGRETKSAVDAGLDCIGHRLAKRAIRPGFNRMQHGVVERAAAAKNPEMAGAI
jgi:hypothetical protein